MLFAMASKKGLTIPAYFTRGQSAGKLVAWKKTDAVIKERSGTIHFEMKNVEAPADWSQLAIEIAASRYFRKSLPGGKKGENSIRALIDRVMLSLRNFSVHQGGYFASKKDQDTFVEEVRYLLLTQRAAFNSPVWFNAGLWDAYKVKSSSEQYAWDASKKIIRRYANAYERPQVSACFIQSVDDSIEGIFELAKTEARLFKYGSGTGSNFSALRSRYEPLQSGGNSSGLISFLEVLDRGAGAIKSGGTTRRAAKMVTVDIDHPEVPEFIDWKMNEEKKAQALVAAGWSPDFEGPAYRTVGGQNANNSVRLTDKFMKLVSADGDWPLRSRVDGKVLRQFKARELFKKVADAAWACADPGVQFHDTINSWHTCPGSGEINGSNPCSEYMFLDDSACNLASINLAKFLREDGGFDLEGYTHAARVLFIAQEIFVDGASYPTAKIALNSHNFRPLGLGFANLGAFLMRQGIAYDSEAGRAWAAALTAMMTGAAFEASAEMARVKGAFAGWKKNKSAMASVMKRHQKSLKAIDWSLLPDHVEIMASQLWDHVVKASVAKGFRNAQATVVAPTGTIGLLMDCDTTGIEPDFSLVKRKKLAGGGDVEIVNRSVEPALRHLGYRSPLTEKIIEYVGRNNSVVGCPDLKVEHQKIFECATGDNSLSPTSHLEMMAAVQPFLSGAISKTVNLPASSSKKDIENVFWKGWELGLKSVAIYRDGSKGGQPLSAKAPMESQFVKCPECGSPTELQSGCYRCPNCGFSVGCA